MLIYRFPGQSIVSKSGSFFLDELTQNKGFIIVDFIKQFNYVFREMNEESSFPFLGEVPFVISRSAYLRQAEEIVSLLKSNSLQKLVYSRVKSVPLHISGLELFHRLEQSYPSAFVYYFNDVRLGQWIGATPEILVKGKEQQFESISLAGTKNVKDLDEWGSKEREEQIFVSDFLLELLKNKGFQNVHINGPNTILAGPIAHLRTDFSWESTVSEAFDFAHELHPTPAVSGTPRNEALTWIRDNEEHQRQFYAGIIGEMEENELNLYVNLRCAQIQNNQLYLYVGGGFTANSDPQKEWEETENKSRTLLDLL